jgi:hypothetical protein
MSEPTRNIGAFLQSVAPIIVTAPSARNGITLLQRLLNSTPDTIVFGENTMLVDHLPRLVLAATKTHADHGAAHAASLRRFLDEGGEYWSSDLWPDTESFVRIALGAFAQAVSVYAETAEGSGRGRWGIKNPMTDPDMVARLRMLLPAARIVFIHRDLFDVARSAKARRFVQTDDDLDRLADAWQANLLRMLDAADDRVLVIRYEDLVGGPEETIAGLESFAGVGGIDRAIMARRINTFAGTEAPDGYVEPAPLSDGETALLARRADAGLRAAGYAARETGG